MDIKLLIFQIKWWWCWRMEKLNLSTLLIIPLLLHLLLLQPLVHFIVFLLASTKMKWCEVVPIEASHVLLGRPWQYDRHVQHDSYTNKFTFESKECTYSLTPLTTKEVRKDQMVMGEKREKVKSHNTYTRK